MNPALSIIIPVYNVEKYLEACIHSIETQSFHDYEVILVDDGSTDGSPGICDAYAGRDARARVLHAENGGVSQARNTGIDMARGSWIWFIDGDDLLANEDVLREMMAFTTEPALEIAVSRCVHFPDGVTVRAGNTGCAAYEITTSCEKLLKYVAGEILMSSLISRKAIGDIRFDTGIRLGEDVLFIITVASGVNKAVLYDKVCYCRRLRSGSAMHTDYIEGDMNEGYKVLQLLYPILHEKPGGENLYEKYYVDQTGLINKLCSNYRQHGREMRIIRKRIIERFPHYWRNPLITAPTKIFLTSYMITPNGFFFFFRQYKAAKAAWHRLRAKSNCDRQL